MEKTQHLKTSTPGLAACGAGLTRPVVLTGYPEKVGCPRCKGTQLWKNADRDAGDDRHEKRERAARSALVSSLNYYNAHPEKLSVAQVASIHALLARWDDAEGSKAMPRPPAPDTEARQVGSFRRLESDPFSYAVEFPGMGEVGQVLDLSDPDVDGEGPEGSGPFGPDLVLAEWLGESPTWPTLGHAVETVTKAYFSR